MKTIAGEVEDAYSRCPIVRTTKVLSDSMGGVRSGMNGTPTFFINGIRHDDGAYDFASMVAGIPMRLAADSSA